MVRRRVGDVRCDSAGCCSDCSRSGPPHHPPLLQRLGYRFQRRLVGAYWERAGDEAAFDDGAHSLIGANHYVYGELIGQQPVQDWLIEHRINLGNSDEVATHWLLIDQKRNCGYLSRSTGAPASPGTAPGGRGRAPGSMTAPERPVRSAESDAPFYNVDEQIGEGHFYDQSAPIRLQAHVGDEPYAHSRGLAEIVPLTPRGVRSYVLARPYLAIPQYSILVGQLSRLWPLVPAR